MLTPADRLSIMRAPEFWQRRGPAACVLAPLGAVYGLGARLRQRLAQTRAVDIPVICAGNLTVGGAGKTPTALALAATLGGLGCAPHFLTRGHGGRLAGPVQVDRAVHGAADVGDEPLLLAAAAPTWVSRDRYAGARAALTAGAQAIVMDDGLQNPGLRKTLSFAVVDGGTGFGNGLVMPAGPLRERVADGLRRVQAIVLIGPAAPAVEQAVANVAGSLPLLSADFRPAQDAIALKGRRLLVFAGIARPAKFFDMMRGIGCDLAEAVAFADHHTYRDEELAALCAQAQALGATPATTAKDYVRLPPAYRSQVIRIDGGLVFAQPDRLTALVAAALGANSCADG